MAKKKPPVIEQDTVQAWRDIFDDLFDGAPDRQEMLDKQIERYTDGDSASLIERQKAAQDGYANIQRRKA